LPGANGASLGARSNWPMAVVIVHWLTALAVIGLFSFAIGREFLDDKATRQTLLALHRYTGLTVLLAVLLRIPIRLFSAKPEHNLPKLVRIASAAGHGLLYLGLMAAPILGYLLTCARTGHVDYLGIPLPALIERDRDLADTLGMLHGYLGWTMLALVGVHAAMALWHHYVLKDRVLLAMLPRR
jgi:cytochrome b561